MFSSCPLCAFVAGVKIGSGSVSLSRSPGKRDAADGSVADIPSSRSLKDSRAPRIRHRTYPRANQHGAAFELIAVAWERVRIAVHGGGEEMVRKDATQAVEPEQRGLRKDAALIGDRDRQDVVEGGQAIRGDNHEMVAGIVDVADLPTGVQFAIGQRGFEQGRISHTLVVTRHVEFS